jgi:hypothetical protein
MVRGDLVEAHDPRPGVRQRVFPSPFSRARFVSFIEILLLPACLVVDPHRRRNAEPVTCYRYPARAWEVLGPWQFAVPASVSDELGGWAEGAARLGRRRHGGTGPVSRTAPIRLPSVGLSQPGITDISGRRLRDGVRRF